MHEIPVRSSRAQLYCRAEIKEMVRTLKCGGETYDEVLRRMADQYDPAASREMGGSNDGV